jgi:sortase A
MRRLGIFLAALACTIPATAAHASAQSTSVERNENLYSSVAQKKLGQLRIPSLGVSSTIYQGVTDAQFDIGVGEWPGGPQPGMNGNIVIGGHRTAAKRPFAKIDKLKKGDAIFLTRGGKTFRYQVTKTFIVTKNDVWITKPTATATLTLFTCHPVGKTSHRYIIRASYVSK